MIAEGAARDIGLHRAGRTGRHRTARLILEAFARFVDRGMVPNHFPGAGDTPRYNSVDAALWYVEAWRAYVEASGDREALARVFPLLEEIVDWHCQGTRHGIGLDPADLKQLKVSTSVVQPYT